jgi:putative ABC transport system permease protein
MLKNYFKVAWRNLLKNRSGSAINIGGLAVGMAAALIIGLWVWDELSFDKYHDNYSQIALVMQRQVVNKEINTMPVAPIPLATALKSTYGHYFSRVVKASFSWDHVIANGETKVLKPGCFMDTEGPAMFTLRMKEGIRDGLKDPSSVLISQSTGKALFGGADPLGRTLLLDGNVNVKVAGVYEDLPANTTLHDELAFIAPWNLYYMFDPNLKNANSDWTFNAFRIFVEVAANEDMNKASEAIKNAKRTGVDEAEAPLKPEMFLQPMSKWHLYSEFKNGVNTGGGIRYVQLFSIIGVFILLLACINFMNLSTARAENRAREIGLRKAVGSARGQLILQFFSESLVVVVCSFILALLLVPLALPWFNTVAGKEMGILWGNPLFWAISLGFCVITGLIAGSYPALYLSSFKAVNVLKGTFKAGPFSALQRKSLVVLQFGVSIILIVATIVVFRQIQFARNRPVGYDRERLISSELLTMSIHDHFAAFRVGLLGTGVVSGVAESNSTTTGIYNSAEGISWRGQDPSAPAVFPTVGVTYEYGKTVGWQFVEGRDFSPQFAGDSASLVINEAAAKYMGFKKGVGEIVQWGKHYTVIGVIKDMVMESPYEPVRPTLFYINPGMGGFLNIKIAAGVSNKEALAKIEGTFKQYSPSEPFTYKFVNEEYVRKFAAEQRVGDLAGAFSILAIFISCIGLLGMAAFAAEQRTKEIGIRKVVGASIMTIWMLLLKDFVRMIVIALIIAIPLAYYFINNWLQGYQYRVDLSWWIFAATAIGAMFVTVLTVSFQAIKAALANPVKSLRTP